jgi:hypothetical protein
VFAHVKSECDQLVIELSLLNSVACHLHTIYFSCECCAEGIELCVVFSQMFVIELQSECKAKTCASSIADLVYGSAK